MEEPGSRTARVNSVLCGAICALWSRKPREQMRDVESGAGSSAVSR